jgi:hypothetical protein
MARIRISEKYNGIFRNLEKDRVTRFPISTGDIGVLKRLEKRINRSLSKEGINVFYDRRKKEAVILRSAKVKRINWTRKKKNKTFFFYKVTF